MWTRARVYDLIFLIVWPLLIMAFWAVAQPESHAALEASRVGVVTLFCYLWGVASRRRG
jgi:hypothetical protein